MATELIATGEGEASSADQTITDGASLTVAMKGRTATANVLIELKDDGAAYQTVGELNNRQPAVCINAPGVYRLTRTSSGTCGVFSA